MYRHHTNQRQSAPASQTVRQSHTQGSPSTIPPFPPSPRPPPLPLYRCYLGSGTFGMASSPSLPLWAVSRPGPPGYCPSFGAPRLFGASKSEAQVFHSSSAVAAADSLALPSDPLEDAASSALLRLEAASSAEVRAFWASSIASFQARASALAPTTASWLRRAPTHVQSVLAAASPTGVHVALFDWATRQAAVPGAELLTRDWLQGFPLLGEVPIDPPSPSRSASRNSSGLPPSSLRRPQTPPRPWRPGPLPVAPVPQRPSLAMGTTSRSGLLP